MPKISRTAPRMKPVLFIGDPKKQLPTLQRMPDVDLMAVDSVGDAELLLKARDSTEIGSILLQWTSVRQISELQALVSSAAETPAALEVVVTASRKAGVYAERIMGAGAFWLVTTPTHAMHLRRVLKAAEDTSELRRGILRRDQECSTVLSLTQTARLRFRTPVEARILAERFGALSPDPQTVVALLELLINSIEHGNLSIDYQLKGELLASERFELEIQRRLESPEYRQRFTLLEVETGDGFVDLTITDSGDGFDWTRYLTMTDDRILDNHGRGILLACTALEVQYFAPGNKVRVRIPLSAEKCDPRFAPGVS